MNPNRRRARRCVSLPSPLGTLTPAVVVIIVIVARSGTAIDSALQTLTALAGLAAAWQAGRKRAAGAGTDTAGI
ncbi:hypothetical protein [Streptomyces sp. 1222.5]|uniref:hypothetical protein n=1 Tax=Streptomyces sp. 1222.5 TaxID=1881026 RepID=UPI003D723217